MRLYETKTPGEFLALQLDPQELARIRTTAREWRAETMQKELFKGGYSLLLGEIASALMAPAEQARLEKTLAPLAKMIDQGDGGKLKTARLWARYWSPYATTAPDFGVTAIDGAAKRINERAARNDYQDKWDCIVYSRPLAECLTVYRLRGAAVWTNPDGRQLADFTPTAIDQELAQHEELLRQVLTQESRKCAN